MTGSLSLKPSVCVEPLFARFRCWTQLVPPATAALNLKEKLVPLLEGFVRDPETRERARRDSGSFGRRFPLLDEGCVAAVAELLDWMKRECVGLLTLADSIREMERMLERHPRGSSLMSLYRRVPEALRGHVELVYDGRESPSVRFLEGSLYRSSLYNKALQGVFLFEKSGDGEVLNSRTPRIGTGILPVPLAHRGLDHLFASTGVPTTLDELSSALEIESEELRALLPLFDHQASTATTSGSTTGDIRVRYFGHGCVLIEWSDTAIVIDPLLSVRSAGTPERFSYSDLPRRIDCVLITHGHRDHLDVETLLRLRHRTERVLVPRNGTGTLFDPSLRLVLTALGFPDVREMTEFETVKVGDGTVMALPFLGEHCDLNIAAKTGYAVTIKGRSVVFLADSCVLEPKIYRGLRSELGSISLLFIGMECEGSPLSLANGPYLSVAPSAENDASRVSRGSNFEETCAVVRELKPERTCIYAMLLEPWVQHLAGRYFCGEQDVWSRPSVVESDRFLTWCRENGVLAHRPYGRWECSV